MRKLFALFVLVLLLHNENSFAQSTTTTANKVNTTEQKSLKELLHQELKNDVYGVPVSIRPKTIDILMTYAGEKARLNGFANPTAAQKKSIATELQTLTTGTKQKLVALKLSSELADKLTMKVDELQPVTSK